MSLPDLKNVYFFSRMIVKAVSAVRGAPRTISPPSLFRTHVITPLSC